MSPVPRYDSPKKPTKRQWDIPRDDSDDGFVQRMPFAGPPPDYEVLPKILEKDYGRKFTYEEAKRFGIFIIRITKALD